MASIFSKIVSGELPSYKVLEDNDHLAFLDIQPIAKGHTLVIPKKEVDYIFDMKDEALANLIQFAKKVALKMDGVFDAERIGMAVIGLEVPHAHIHLVPLNSVSDIDFSQPKLKLDTKDFEEVLAKLS